MRAGGLKEAIIEQQECGEKKSGPWGRACAPSLGGEPLEAQRVKITQD